MEADIGKSEEVDEVLDHRRVSSQFRSGLDHRRVTSKTIAGSVRCSRGLAKR